MKRSPCPVKVIQRSLLPSFNLVSSGKECKSCSACSLDTKPNHRQNKMAALQLRHNSLYITFLLKYFSNLTRPMVTHCSHWLGRLLSSLMTWNDPSGLSPLCILWGQSIVVHFKHIWGRRAACPHAERSADHTCSTASGDGWVCQNKLYMEGLWTKAFSNWPEQEDKVLMSR